MGAITERIGIGAASCPTLDRRQPFRIFAVADLPADVVEHLRSIFSACNARTTEKLSTNPNVPEESLDLSWIEHMSRHSAPVALPSDWLVKVETHYLGGMRHYYRWEIADIGLLVHLRLDESGRRSKVALLQSKRLYPDGAAVREETIVDYEIGFGRLADPEDDAISIAFATDFSFGEDSAYGQIRQGSNQVAAIDEYEREVGLKVYYQLYNPWSVPFAQRVPLVGFVEHEGEPDLGVRVIPSPRVHARLAESGRSPQLRDLAELDGLPPFGWRLEHFVCDELLGCREGDRFESITDARIQQLFNRRSGAIAAAIAITVEAPRPRTASA